MRSAVPFGQPNLTPAASGLGAMPSTGLESRDPAMTPEQLETLQAQLVQAQRRALLAETAGMLAHEYNNLMTPVLARASYAISQNDTELNHKTLERIVTQVNKALDLSRHLLRFFETDDESRAGCSVLAVVESSLQDTVRPLKKDGIEVNVDVPAELRARGPAVLLEQVVLNLVLNARAALKDRRGRITVVGQTVAGLVEIEVHDSGDGIARELRDTVFSPFLSNTTQELVEAPEAIGLGLKLCRLIVSRHGGSLRVADSPEGGCCFTVCWPAESGMSNTAS